MLKLQNEANKKEIEKQCISEPNETVKLRLELLATEALMLDGRMGIGILEFSQQKRARLIRLDGVLGGVGTFIWGFGDLQFTSSTAFLSVHVG